MPATPAPTFDARPPAVPHPSTRAARAALPWALALGCGAILWLVALRSGRFDWSISETHAHIIYSALRRFRELPLFSYYLNQGSYLLQDPQFPLLSITTPLVLALGPEAGLRFAAFAWGVAGFWAWFAWARRHLGDRPAALGAISWVLSLGVLWRIAVGNDMFLWFLALPLLLLLVEEVIETGRPRSAARLGIAAGVCVLGPSFHAVTYLLAPACAVYALVFLLRRRLGFSSYARRAALLALALAVTAAVALPRVVAWTTFDMRRPIERDGTMALGAALESLASPLKTSPRERIRVEGVAREDGVDLVRPYGIWESATALPGVGTLLAILGAIAGARRGGRAAKGGRGEPVEPRPDEPARPSAELVEGSGRPDHAMRLWTFAALCVAVGLVLTSSALAWDSVRALAPSLRVSRRFLVVSGFGLSILAAMGYAELEARVRRVPGAVVLAAALAVVLASTGVWIQRAARDGLLLARAAAPISHPRFAPLPVPAVSAQKVPSAIASDRILTTLFFSVGNPCPSRWRGGFYCEAYAERVMRGPLGQGWPEYPAVVPTTAPVTVSHTALRFGRIEPGEKIQLALLARPALGYALDVTPREATLRLDGSDESLTVANVGSVPVEQARLAPRLPMTGARWAAWAGLLVVAALLAAGPRRRLPAEAPAGAAGAAGQ